MCSFCALFRVMTVAVMCWRYSMFHLYCFRLTDYLSKERSKFSLWKASTFSTLLYCPWAFLVTSQRLYVVIRPVNVQIRRFSMHYNTHYEVSKLFLPLLWFLYAKPPPFSLRSQGTNAPNPSHTFISRRHIPAAVVLWLHKLHSLLSIKLTWISGGHQL